MKWEEQAGRLSLSLFLVLVLSLTLRWSAYHFQCLVCGQCVPMISLYVLNHKSLLATANTETLPSATTKGGIPAQCVYNEYNELFFTLSPCVPIQKPRSALFPKLRKSFKAARLCPLQLIEKGFECFLFQMILEGSFDSLTAYCEILACWVFWSLILINTLFKRFAISLYLGVQVFLIPYMCVENIKEILWLC